MINQRHPDFPEVDLSYDALVPPTMRKDIAGIDQISPSQKTQIESFSGNSASQKSLSGKTNSQSNITMLVIYSAEFSQGFASPTARINDLLNFTNSLLSDSDVDITFALVRAQQINFDNSLSTNELLDQVTYGRERF